jgi:hypothetical protein
VIHALVRDHFWAFLSHGFIVVYSPPMNAQPKRTRTLAVTSLVLGILALVALSIVAGIPAVITGHIARSRVGRGFAVLARSDVQIC